MLRCSKKSSKGLISAKDRFSERSTRKLVSPFILSIRTKVAFLLLTYFIHIVIKELGSSRVLR